MAADDVVTYEAQWHSTLRPEQHALAAETLGKLIAGSSVTNLAVDASVTGLHALRISGVDFSASEVVDLEPTLWQLRRRKDLDELALMQKAIDCTEAMYVRAQEIMEPGIHELDVFNELQAVAVKTAGEPLTAS